MRHLCKWAAIGICALLALLTLFLVVPGLFGIHPLIVQNQNMEPDYPAGSLLYITQAKMEEEEMTFYLSEDETPVTGILFFSIPYLGYVAGYLSSPAGKFGIFILVILVFLLSWMDASLLQEQNKGQKFDIIPKK